MSLRSTSLDLVLVYTLGESSGLKKRYGIWYATTTGWKIYVTHLLFSTGDPKKKKTQNSYGSQAAHDLAETLIPDENHRDRGALRHTAITFALLWEPETILPYFDKQQHLMYWLLTTPPTLPRCHTRSLSPFHLPPRCDTFLYPNTFWLTSDATDYRWEFISVCLCFVF